VYEDRKMSSPARESPVSGGDHWIRWHAWVIVTWMALGQVVGKVITWWQVIGMIWWHVIGMIWWEPRPDDVG
jgi:hypothetical protein